MQWFRGGLVSKAHTLCVSLNSRLDSSKEEKEDTPHLPLSSELGTHAIVKTRCCAPWPGHEAQVFSFEFEAKVFRPNLRQKSSDPFNVFPSRSAALRGGTPKATRVVAPPTARIEGCQMHVLRASGYEPIRYNSTKRMC